MSAQPITCRLEEPDGTPLAGGMVRLASADEAEVTGLDRPGRVVQRCLLGGLREVVVRLGEGAPITAYLERIAFDARQGRVCLLRLRDPMRAA